MGWMDTLGKIGNIASAVVPGLFNLGFGIANTVKSIKSGGNGQRDQYGSFGSNPYDPGAAASGLMGAIGNIGSMIKKGFKTFQDFRSGNIEGGLNRLGKIKDVFHQGVSNIGNMVGAFSQKAGNKINAWNQKAQAPNPLISGAIGLGKQVFGIGKELYNQGKTMFQAGQAAHKANVAQYRSGDKFGAVENGINVGMNMADKISNGLINGARSAIDAGRRGIQLLNEAKAR